MLNRRILLHSRSQQRCAWNPFKVAMVEEFKAEEVHTEHDQIIYVTDAGGNKASKLLIL